MKTLERIIFVDLLKEMSQLVISNSETAS